MLINETFCICYKFSVFFLKYEIEPFDSSFALSTYHTVLVLAALLIIVCFVICVPARCIKRYTYKSFLHKLYIHSKNTLKCQH